jgi:two-component system CheB/CheR fusion protein
MSAHRSPTRGKERPQRPRPAQKRLVANSEGNFPVVAIGASAGGLEAFRTLLTTLPAESGMAFILIQVLSG